MFLSNFRIKREAEREREREMFGNVIFEFKIPIKRLMC